MKKILFLSILIGFLLSCQLTDSENPALGYEMQQVERYSGDCDGSDASCAMVSVNWPVFHAGDRSLTDSINFFIQNQVKELLYLGDNPRKFPLISIQALTDSFLQTYNRLVSDLPEYPTQWSNEVKMHVLHHNTHHITLSLEQYVYTGGAHPNSYRALFTLDPASGKEMQINQLVRDTLALYSKAERAFRQARALNPHEALSEAGFFWGEPFKLPANIALLEDSVLFYYNSYEIAPYVLGPTEFRIAQQELEGILKTR